MTTLSPRKSTARDQRGRNCRVRGPTKRGKEIVVYASFSAYPKARLRRTMAAKRRSSHRFTFSPGVNHRTIPSGRGGISGIGERLSHAVAAGSAGGGAADPTTVTSG